MSSVTPNNITEYRLLALHKYEIIQKLRCEAEIVLKEKNEVALSGHKILGLKLKKGLDLFNLPFASNN